MSGSRDRPRVARRFTGIVRKEALQIVRDPSSILIAFVLPGVLLVLFAFAISLDLRAVSVGVVIERDTAEARDLAAALASTRYLDARFAADRRALEPVMDRGEIRGLIVIPQDFAPRLASGRATVQVITDGSAPNTANFVAQYARGVIDAWQRTRTGAIAPPITVEPRFWYNPSLESRAFIVPGAIAIVMTMIGTMLTALVVAREWERGTMEALIATPIGVVELLAGKLLPYFVLGLIATVACAVIATAALDVPFRGSWPALLILSSAFLVPALGQGLLISAAAKNQFVAAQVALFSGFLPAFLLSGFLFEIDSMPEPLQWLTHIVAAKYFVAALKTLFLSGDVWGEFARALGPMLAIGAVMFALAVKRTRKRLD